MNQNNRNKGSIGQQFEAARKAKGISISEAGKATKIISKFIEAMESNDFGKLYAPVYAKGFIRLYARYLGLDAQPLVEEYIAQHAAKSSPPPKQNPMQAGGSIRAGVEDGSLPKRENNNALRALFSGFPVKTLCVAVGTLLCIGIVILGVTQCTDNEAESPVSGASAAVEYFTISDVIPDVYLVGPGVVDINKK